MKNELLAVKLCLGGRPLKSVARQLGINKDYISEWLCRYLQEGESGLQKRSPKRALSPKCFEARYSLSVKLVGAQSTLSIRFTSCPFVGWHPTQWTMFRTRIKFGDNERRTPICNRQNEQSNQTDSLENTKNQREWHGYGMFIGESKIWIMIYGYIRVSSDKQTVENQRFEIERFCKVNNLHIDGWIEETISGTKAYNKRQLGVLLKKVEKEDVIICSELSRLGRSLFMIMEILSICMKKECRVWTIKDNYRLGDDIQSKVLAFAFGLSAEIERNLISQRTKEALARKRAEGVQLGRPKGKQSRQCTYKLHKKEDLIRGLLAEGVSFKKIGNILHVNKDTVRKYYHTFMES